MPWLPHSCRATSQGLCWGLGLLEVGQISAHATVWISSKGIVRSPRDPQRLARGTHLPVSRKGDRRRGLQTQAGRTHVRPAHLLPPLQAQSSEGHLFSPAMAVGLQITLSSARMSTGLLRSSAAGESPVLEEGVPACYRISRLKSCNTRAYAGSSFLSDRRHPSLVRDATPPALDPQQPTTCFMAG